MALLGSFQAVLSGIESMLQGAEDEDAHGLDRLVLAAEGFDWENVLRATNAT